MSTMTFQEMSPEEKKSYKATKLHAIRQYHSELINDLGISIVDFNMKMAFYNQRGEMVVGIFESEFKKEKGFFFELITRDLEPADENRTVYRIAPTKSFYEEYELNEKGSYLVPLEELRVVNPQSVAITKSAAVTSSDAFALASKQSQQVYQQPAVTAYKAPAAMEDAPASEMTIRDYYAIHSNKAVSAKGWLNDLIKSNK